MKTINYTKAAKNFRVCGEEDAYRCISVSDSDGRVYEFRGDGPTVTIKFGSYEVLLDTDDNGKVLDIRRSLF